MKSLQDIVDALQGYDPQAMPVDQVLDFLEQMVEPITQTESIDLIDALDRILAGELISPLDVPPHDNSAMDGYAFDGAALQPGQDLRLQLVGTAWAGQAWSGRAAPVQCVRIMTGAIMPAGLDTVLPQELAQVSADGLIVTIPADRIVRGDNRRLRGEDLRRGEPALADGVRLNPARLGLSASLGIERLQVYRQPVVACFSTGDEILPAGHAPREGAVYDSNRYTLIGLLQRLGCQVLDLGLVRDDPAQLQAAFERAAVQADAVISSGGVSVGQADHTKAMIGQLGEVVLWRVAMRPGRPLAVGRIKHPSRSRGTLVFGLPGNPVAVMVTFLAFVRPALRRLMGCRDAPPPLLQARSQHAIRKRAGRTEYQRGWVSLNDQGQLQVSTTGDQGSGILSSMSHANGLIVLHHSQESVQAGEMVSVMMFEGVL
jgi:molybdopterin molybdotransferase